MKNFSVRRKTKEIFDAGERTKSRGRVGMYSCPPSTSPMAHPENGGILPTNILPEIVTTVGKLVGMEYMPTLPGSVYKTSEGNWTYTEPKAGTEDSSPIVVPPGDAKVDAWYHTHSGDNPKYDNKHFSDADKWFSDRSGKPSYMVDPKGGLHKYSPDPKERGKGKTENLGKCP